MLRAGAQRLLQPMLRAGQPAAPTKVAQVQNNAMQRRGVQSANSGPPKHPLSNSDLIILGGGFMLSIILLPLWGIFSVPGWAKIHKSSG